MIKGLNNIKFVVLILQLFFQFVQISAQNRFHLHDVLHENSGLIYLNKDSCWWINDSGNKPELFITNNEGKLINKINLNATNTDWEDLTIDENKNIYIGDFGNNELNRHETQIYKINLVTNKTDSLIFQYGKDKKQFDCEAFVWHKSKLHFFTKGINAKKDYNCHHYTINDHQSKQIAELAGSINLKPYVVTGACISPDGSVLALLSYRYKFIMGFLPDTDSRIYFFNIRENFTSVEKRMIGFYTIPTWFFTRQYESIDYINDHKIMLGAEKTFILRPLIRNIKIPSKFR